jgi:folate-binding protein YgfZ
MNSYEVFLQGRQGLVSNHLVFKVSGEDREKYFQGQTTNDVIGLPVNSSQLNSRIDRSGKIQFFFTLLKASDSLYILIDEKIAEVAIGELNKFIIMDEVEIEQVSSKAYFSIGTKKLKDSSFKGFVFGLPGFFYISDVPNKLEELSEDEMNFLCIDNGWPRLGVDIILGQLINETRLDELSVSYTKGCFLGQETVSKIHHGRGASYLPVKFISENCSEFSLGKFDINGRKGGEVVSLNKYFVLGKVFREFRIENKEFKISQNGKEINSRFSSYQNKFDLNSFAKAQYLYAVSLFQDSQEESAVNHLKQVIILDPTLADAYESLGVIYGRQNRFEEAIELMDSLLEVDSESVLAHTNKSLFLMNLGKIEEAEEEKGLATVKSFAQFGKEAAEKRKKEDIEKEKNEQMLQRESMFKQVLEIDSKDTIANFGMADIYFYRKEYSSAKQSLLAVLKADEKYSMAYLLLGKTLEMLNENSEAIITYEKGIAVASSKGELMPANEMQSRLLKLN